MNTIGKRKKILRFILKSGRKSLFLQTKRKNSSMFEINNIKIGGITNIKEASLSLNDLTALVAPNNYGKSNVLTAIDFAIAFIGARADERLRMMSTRNFIPINTSMEDVPFSFEISGKTEWGKDSYEIVYGFSFEWAKTDKSKQGCRIIAEYLRAKTIKETKYSAYLKREKAEAASYRPTVTSRSSKELSLDNGALALDKLSNIDGLFYLDIIKAIQSISIFKVNTLDNPDAIFSSPYPAPGTNDYSIAIPGPGEIGFFINSLKVLAPDKYELLKNTIEDLIPNIEDFEPVQIDLSKKADVPFQMPDIFFDIRIKERFNNQYTSINNVSTGCKKILYVLTMALAASINHVSLLEFEELENSVHPRLLQNLLQTVTTLSEDTKILTTSHSPFLIRFISPSKIYLGLPSKEGVAKFSTLKPGKVNKVLKMASAEEVSIGEYLFEMMLDAEDDDEMLNEFFA